MQARRSTLYKTKTKKPFFYDTSNNMHNKMQPSATLDKRTPDVGNKYIQARGKVDFGSYSFFSNSTHKKMYFTDYAGSCIQTPFGVRAYVPSMGTGSHLANFLVPKPDNPYPVQGHFGITIKNLYKYRGYRNIPCIYIRCNEPTNIDTKGHALFEKDSSYIRLMFSEKTKPNEFALTLYCRLNKTKIITLKQITIPWANYHTTGPIRIETELTNNTLLIAASAPKVKFELPPTSIDVTGTDFLKRTGAMIYLRAGGTQVHSGNRARIRYPITINNTRKLLL
jgi:hypothetical protein